MIIVTPLLVDMSNFKAQSEPRLIKVLGRNVRNYLMVISLVCLVPAIPGGAKWVLSREVATLILC